MNTLDTSLTLILTQQVCWWSLGVCIPSKLPGDVNGP